MFEQIKIFNDILIFGYEDQMKEIVKK